MTSHTPSRRQRRAAVPALTLAIGLLLAACGGDSSPDAPRRWIADTYQRGTGSDIYLDSANGPSRVADAIDDETSAEDRITSNGEVFLRYDDAIVAVTPQLPGGSRIEIEDYRRGVQRWHSSVGHRWSASQGDSFRGGGPGSGK
ncbi:DUF4247 domain-containing protein [Streptomyces sp. DSM 44915]|uniref:DUF4247 domain-containing protein n=1 Tax=Streptomyces chisholmiae TaxID=3075540 RepID=A0ABU2K1R2_9ACTN|nr:DUF4247 domain-containing protein [Streptomyces sp. DSM 44915]MDT0270709.1 DUF4247 domain-containing protein [Streptomyces sp. DSM 44915]